VISKFFAHSDDGEEMQRKDAKLTRQKALEYLSSPEYLKQHPLDSMAFRVAHGNR
jgi:hypothetical protein